MGKEMNPIIIAIAVSGRRHRDDKKEEISISESLFVLGCIIIIFLIGLLIGCLFISG